MSYYFTEEPTFKTAAATPKFSQVVATTTAGQVDIAVGASTKIIGFTNNETFAADEKVSVCLYEGKVRVGIASAAIAVGDFVEVTAAGKLVTVAGPTNLVALTAAAADLEYFTYCKCGAKGV